MFACCFQHADKQKLTVTPLLCVCANTFSDSVQASESTYMIQDLPPAVYNLRMSASTAKGKGPTGQQIKFFIEGKQPFRFYIIRMEDQCRSWFLWRKYQIKTFWSFHCFTGSCFQSRQAQNHSWNHFLCLSNAIHASFIMQFLLCTVLNVTQKRSMFFSEIWIKVITHLKCLDEW